MKRLHSYWRPSKGNGLVDEASYICHPHLYIHSFLYLLALVDPHPFEFPIRNLFQLKKTSLNLKLILWVGLVHLNEESQRKCRSIITGEPGELSRYIGKLYVGLSRNRNSIPGRARYIYFLHNIQTESRAHSEPYWMGDGGSYPEVKQPWPEADQTLLPRLRILATLPPLCISLRGVALN
jgi:hypothetical protein